MKLFKLSEDDSFEYYLVKKSDKEYIINYSKYYDNVLGKRYIGFYNIGIFEVESDINSVLEKLSDAELESLDLTDLTYYQYDSDLNRYVCIDTLELTAYPYVVYEFPASVKYYSMNRVYVCATREIATILSFDDKNYTVLTHGSNLKVKLPINIEGTDFFKINTKTLKEDYLIRKDTSSEKIIFHIKGIISDIQVGGDVSKHYVIENDLISENEISEDKLYEQLNELQASLFEVDIRRGYEGNENMVSLVNKFKSLFSHNEELDVQCYNKRSTWYINLINKGTDEFIPLLSYNYRGIVDSKYCPFTTFENPSDIYEFMLESDEFINFYGQYAKTECGYDNEFLNDLRKYISMYTSYDIKYREDSYSDYIDIYVMNEYNDRYVSLLSVDKNSIAKSNYLNIDWIDGYELLDKLRSNNDFKLLFKMNQPEFLYNVEEVFKVEKDFKAYISNISQSYWDLRTLYFGDKVYFKVTKNGKTPTAVLISKEVDKYSVNITIGSYTETKLVERGELAQVMKEYVYSDKFIDELKPFYQSETVLGDNDSFNEFKQFVIRLGLDSSVCLIADKCLFDSSLNILLKYNNGECVKHLFTLAESEFNKLDLMVDELFEDINFVNKVYNDGTNDSSITDTIDTIISDKLDGISEYDIVSDYKVDSFISRIYLIKEGIEFRKHILELMYDIEGIILINPYSSSKMVCSISELSDALGKEIDKRLSEKDVEWFLSL